MRLPFPLVLVDLGVVLLLVDRLVAEVRRLLTGLALTVAQQ